MMRRAAAMMLVSLTLIAGGCGPPRVDRGNRRLVESLYTAVSARNPAWLEENARMLDERRASGELSDAEDRAFRSIVDQARGGDWEGAEDEAFALRRAQRPTREDVEAVPEHARR